MTGRALTPTDKRHAVEALLNAWLSQPHQRLGQLIVNAMGTDDSKLGQKLFYAEDAELLASITEFASRVTERS